MEQDVQKIEEKNIFPYPICRMKVGGVDTIVTKAQAKNPYATVQFIKGFKSSPYLYEELMHTLTDHGINVTLVSLPDPEDEIDFLDDYEHIAKAVYVDGELDHLHNENLPLIAASHSIGGFLMTKLLTEEDSAQKINERYESAFLASPFYGSKYHRIPVIKTFAFLYSTFNGHAYVGTTWLERQFLNAANDTKEGEKALANHKQALYMDVPTHNLIQDIRTNGFPDIARELPITFHLSSHDQVSFNALAKEISGHLNSKVIESIGGHSHIRATEAGRRLLTFDVLDTIQKSWLKTALDEDCLYMQSEPSAP
ncbi:MAG: hypothetical protein ACLFR0_04015 [Alphaproteobacteria bacterium]